MQAQYEHEAAALDLSEAAQAVTQAAARSERGDSDEVEQLTALASELYQRAELHRERARRLES